MAYTAVRNQATKRPPGEKKRMESTSQERREKLRRLSAMLESHKTPGRLASRQLQFPLPDKSKTHKLKYLNLLDPETRAKRWMYTTWHHLPEYKNNNPVNNWSSHFVRTCPPVRHHYVIHPSWG